MSGVCQTYFFDGDGDGFGVSSPTNLCGATPSAKFATQSGDCCDQDRDTRPGQTAFFIARNGCQSFDYDCVGGVVKQWSLLAHCTFTDENSGWSATVPECGVLGRWLSVRRPSTCSGADRTQACH
jgi:hypothetical protein